MMRALGSEKRISFAPAHSNSEPADAACPVHSVDTGGRMNCMVSYIASPDVTTPPGELMYIEISFLGFSASRNSNCATTKVAMPSSIGPVIKTVSYTHLTLPTNREV